MEIVQGRREIDKMMRVALGQSIHNFSKSTPNSVFCHPQIFQHLNIGSDSSFNYYHRLWYIFSGYQEQAISSRHTNTTSTINTSLDRIFKLYC